MRGGESVGARKFGEVGGEFEVRGGGSWR